MATLQTNSTLPDSSNKQDFYDLVENSSVINIVNADISASAAISGSKLATITTAGKVSGAALTSLSSTPSSAGVLPVANIPGSIPYSKLTLTGTILNADVNASAAIVDTKLAQIATAGKVSGASLTSLASIPSGAGIIPVANLPALGMSFVSATTFAGEETKTISGLTTGVPYFIILDLVSASGNADLQLYPNGTLSTISATSGYDSSGNRLRLSSGSFGNGSICSLKIDIRTIQGDTTKTIVLVRGWHSVDGSVNAYGVLDSDADLSSITIGSAAVMTLTGTAYLYKYATS